MYIDVDVECSCAIHYASSFGIYIYSYDLVHGS